MVNNTLTRTGPKYDVAGPLDSMDENPYITENLTYPKNVEELSHIMIFNINVSSYSHDIQDGTEFLAENQSSRSQKLRNGTTLQQKTTADSLIGSLTGGFDVGFNRKTKRIQKSIALYVPETVVFDNKQNYQTPELLPLLGQATAMGVDAVGSIGEWGATILGAMSGMGGGPIAVIGGSLVGATGGSIIKGITNFASDAIRGVSDSSSSSRTNLTALTGYALNPVIDVIYNSPSLRQFSFDFNFAPSSAAEADSVWNIIQSFRQFQAPDIETTGFLGMTGAFFIPPAEFDITFYRQEDNGNFVQNNNIPGISTCVLEEINVNYTPENQWITHKDGFPTHIQMRLMFTEVDIITASRVKQGF